MENFSSTIQLTPPENFVKFEREELEKTITERFEQQVGLHPNHFAVKTGDVVLNYNDLNKLSNQLAYHILDLTVGVQGPIAFLLDNSVSQIIAIMGIIKAGNGYLALDPAFPAPRLAFMISDSETPILITDDKNLAFATQFSNPECQILRIDKISPDTPSENLNRDISIHAMANLQYTSGSTGQPKGCIKTHLLTMHDHYIMTNMHYINPDDRYILLYSASFGASTGPIFSALLNGASLLPYDIKKNGLTDLADFLTREGITIYHSVPSTFRNFASLLKTENGFPSLRFIILGGETVLRKDIDLFKKHFSSTCTFEIILGGTEFQIIRSHMISKNTPITGSVVPVGYPIKDKLIRLLDEAGVEVPIGNIGEIVVESKFISPGYWRQPELTRTAFAPVPGQEEEIQYHTGDLGRMRSDGCLEHLGRKDRQVKIRGHRIELAEILYSLLNIPTVKDAHILAKPDPEGENRLIAYLVLERQTSLSISNIRQLLSENLPDYMIPADYVFLNELPKTPSRKVDVLALPNPERSRQVLDNAYVSPRNQVERQLVGIWESLLDIHPVGIKDDFFELGGHSLLALRFIAEVEEKLGVTIPFPALIQSRTIENISNLIEDRAALNSWSYLVALQPLGSKPPFYCVPPSAVTVMIFKDLAKHLDVDRPFYGLEYSGMDGKTEIHDNIPAMAHFNLERIRAMQPEGPYFLGGMCFGGLVAYEMAHQILSSGDQVAFLGILDSTHAPYRSKPRTYPIFMLTRFLNQKILRNKFPIGMAPLRQAMKKLTPEDDFSKQIYQVFTTHNYARVNYIAKPYSGTITLFNTSGSRGDFSKDQWKAVTKGKLEIVSIPGIHANPREARNEENSFILEPHVQVLAQKLTEYLDKAGLDG